MFLNRTELLSAVRSNIGSAPGYDDEVASRVIDSSIEHANAINTITAALPTPTQQACYADCQSKRDAAFAAAAALGFPACWAAMAAAIAEFNSCRAGCDEAAAPPA